MSSGAGKTRETDVTLFDLTGRRALITGASKGIGYAIAEALAGAGASVVLNARNLDRLEDAKAALAAKAFTVDIAPFDAADPEAVEAGIAAIEQTLGPIDILVNNAGMQLGRRWRLSRSTPGSACVPPISTVPSWSGRLWPAA